MDFISEDATYLAGGLGILAATFFVALKVTQQGRFLVWAGVSLGMALLALLVERVWVTDNERIEQVVYDLRKAVAASDPDGVLVHLAPDVEYVQGEHVTLGDVTRDYIRSELGKVQFDFVRITQFAANAGHQSGRGSAVFRILASGSYESGIGTLSFGTTNLDFSLGFQETSPNVWKVDRITLTRAPRDMPVPGSPQRRNPFSFRPRR